MKKKMYQALQTGENGWWYRGRTRMVSVLFEKYLQKAKLESLDYGAGYGGLAHVMQKLGVVDAVEKHTPCHEALHNRGYRWVFQTKDEVREAGATYDLISFFDVLEHIEDDAAVLRFVHNYLLKDSGRLFVTVPAYQFLYSAHDKASHHHRRYSKKELTRLLRSAGFEPLYVSYWNTTLFPLAMILRLLGKGGGESLSQPKVLDVMLGWILTVESQVLRHFSMPFGLSVVIIARKETSLVNR